MKICSEGFASKNIWPERTVSLKQTQGVFWLLAIAEAAAIGALLTEIVFQKLHNLRIRDRRPDANLGPAIEASETEKALKILKLKQEIVTLQRKLEIRLDTLQELVRS